MKRGFCMFNLVKGTHDVILDEAQKYTYIENICKIQRNFLIIKNLEHQ